MEWIKVEDRLPDQTVNVLVYWRPIDWKKRPYHHEIAVMSRVLKTEENQPETWWGNGQYYDAFHVTHWVPLPEPPNENES